MGQSFQREVYSQEERLTFRQRLSQQLDSLRTELTDPGYSQDDTSLGAELELYIIDEDGYPAAMSMELIEKAEDPLLTEELNKFNLELNLSPVDAKGQPFSAMQTEVTASLNNLRQHANKTNNDILAIGILPTLQNQHLDIEYMTDLPRYRALNRELSELRGEPFNIEIHGQDSLKLKTGEVTMEGANTSFQLHMKVPANRFADCFNAAQLITPLVMAVSCNSPLLLGKRLWQETRIALFKQSTDNRIHDLTEWRQPARVTFGHGWVRQSAWQLFAENVAMYPPLLPFLSDDEKPFSELLTHHGTVWNWNRAVLQPPPNGHLRIEFRSLPAGPSLIDMMANSALAIGLTQAFSHCVEEYISQLPFEYARYNFYRTAQHGLDATILWPVTEQKRPKELPVHRVLQNVLTMADGGLAELGVDSNERQLLLGIIEQRIHNRQTGAQWQLRTLDKLQKTMDLPDALKAMMYQYMDNFNTGNPVSAWEC